MEKLFGIILIAAIVYGGVEIGTKGMDGAFGGLFAEEGVDMERAVESTPARRAAASLERANKARDDRYNRVLEQGE